MTAARELKPIDVEFNPFFVRKLEWVDEQNRLCSRLFHVDDVEFALKMYFLPTVKVKVYRLVWWEEHR